MLRDLRLTVWLDANMSAGETFSDEIDREVHSASAVLVCWSPLARESKWVRAEALVGFEKNKLIASYVSGPDGFVAPAPFNAIHTEDLRSWLTAANDFSPEWRSLLRRIGKLCDRPDLEAWGALDAKANARDLRGWISRHMDSPLFPAADKLLAACEAQDAERVAIERLAREHRARETRAIVAQQQEHEIDSTGFEGDPYGWASAPDAGDLIELDERPALRTRAIRWLLLVAVVCGVGGVFLSRPPSPGVTDEHAEPVPSTPESDAVVSPGEPNESILEAPKSDGVPREDFKLDYLLKRVEEASPGGPNSDQASALKKALRSVRSGISKCWNVPVGAPDPAALVFDVRVFLNQDGTVAGAPELVGRYRPGDPYFRAAVDAALRAVQMCGPYDLPADQYENWREIVVTFDPRDMAGY
jgi:hypothetical protein